MFADYINKKNKITKLNFTLWGHHYIGKEIYYTDLLELPAAPPIDSPENSKNMAGYAFSN